MSKAISATLLLDDGWGGASCSKWHGPPNRGLAALVAAQEGMVAATFGHGGSLRKTRDKLGARGLEACVLVAYLSPPVLAARIRPGRELR